MLRLWIRSTLAKADGPPDPHTAVHGGRPIVDNPNLMKKQVVDRNGRVTTRYVRRAPKATKPRRPAPAKPAAAPRQAREALHNGSEHTLSVARIEDGRAHLESSAGLGPYHLPVASVDHHFQEVEKRVAIDEPSRNRYVEAVRTGKAKFLGQGEDGMVFQVGDKAVKVSTVTPFQRYNHRAFRTPEEGLRRLRGQVELTERMRADGIPGVPETEFVAHGDRGFAIQAMLDLPEKLTGEQLEGVQRSVLAMHRAGYTVNDQIQVGIGKDGKPYHFDLGHAEHESQLRPGDTIASGIANDKERLRTLYHQSEHVWEPLSVDANHKLKWRQLLSDKWHKLRTEHEGEDAIRQEFEAHYGDLIRAAKEDDDTADFAVGLEGEIARRADSFGLDPQAFRPFRDIYFAD